MLMPRRSWRWNPRLQSKHQAHQVQLQPQVPAASQAVGPVPLTRWKVMVLARLAVMMGHKNFHQKPNRIVQLGARWQRRQRQRQRPRAGLGEPMPGTVMRAAGDIVVTMILVMVMMRAITSFTKRSAKLHSAKDGQMVHRMFQNFSNGQSITHLRSCLTKKQFNGFWLSWAMTSRSMKHTVGQEMVLPHCTSNVELCRMHRGNLQRSDPGLKIHCSFSVELRFEI